MKISQHADNTEKLYGIRAEDIHKWIDGFFDSESLRQFLQFGKRDGYNPYKHRKYRHSLDALEDAYREFTPKYTKQQIRNVLESHIRDDYDGYIPTREDFENGTFKEKYHESDERHESENIFSTVELADYFKGKHYAQQHNENKKHLNRFYLRIVLPTVIAIILFVSSIFIFVIPIFRNNMMESKKRMLKELIQTATSTIDTHIEEEELGKVSREEAQKEAINELQHIRYGSEGKDYFWITDMHPRMIMHPYRPDLIGKDLTNYVDTGEKSKTKIFVEFVDIVRKNGKGFVKYHWQDKHDPTKLVPKLSYVCGIPQWGWVIGTGIYINDVEEELSHLTAYLSEILLAISASLFIVIFYIVIQSRKIEQNKLREEAGLIEAKERYRALVEASNEGYILVIQGKNIYSNHVLEQMLGYSEQELASEDIWEKILPDRMVNADCIASIRKVLRGESAKGEFDVELKTRSSNIIEATLTISRAFFSHKDGHIITFRRILSKKSILDDNSVQIEDAEIAPEEIIEKIKNTTNRGSIIRTLNSVPTIARHMFANKAESAQLRKFLSDIFEVATLQFIKIALENHGPVKQKFAFLSLGSNARGEMTLFSDQDNAIVFEDVAKDKIEALRSNLLTIADSICNNLDKAGYHFCIGGIMAVNPKWCLSVSEWKKRFSREINNSSPESLKDINTVYDIKCIYGDMALLEELQNHIIDIASSNQEFLMHFARHCLTYETPLNTFGNLRFEKVHDAKLINLKESLATIVNFARIYALREKITKASTLDRLEELTKMNVIKQDTFDEMSSLFEILWRLRFYNQIICHSQLREVNDMLDIKDISERELKKLKSALSYIQVFQTKLSYDFLGVAQI